MVTKYRMVNSGGENTCSECAALNGKVFDSEDDIPDTPHPNCNCYVEEFDDEEESGDDFEVIEEVSSSSPANETDVVNTKEALCKLGYYETPSYGMTPYPDKPMFDGIKQFQADNGLKEDGVIKHGGETEKALRERLECTPLDIAKQAFDNYKIAEAKSPLSSGNYAVDKYVGKAVPVIGYYNKGFSAGRGYFAIKQAYDDLCE